MVNSPKPFWHTKYLQEMTTEEWELLCDGCARCCMVKFEDEASGCIDYTRVACHLLDTHDCRCTDYENRSKRVPDCVRIKPTMERRKFEWLPKSCAYRRLSEGRELADWHPLHTKDHNTVHSEGISMRGRCVSEAYVPSELLEEQIISFDEFD